MVDLNRQIRATQARQGGFSSHVLPGAVPYAVATNLIIYYTATEVSSTNAGSIITPDLNSGSSYGVTSFQGANAFSPTGGGQPGGRCTVTLGSLTPGTDDFTLEASGEVSSGTPASDYTGFTLYSSDGLFYCEMSMQQSVTDRWRRRVEYGTFAGGGDNSGTNVVFTRPPVTHMCAQRINGQFYFHFNGQVESYEEYGPLGAINLNGGYILIEVLLSNFGAKLGQVRFTGGTAIYGTGSFTPPTGPFFTP